MKTMNIDSETRHGGGIPIGQVKTECFRTFAKLLHTFANLSEEDREGILSMASIVVDPESTDDEVEAALATMEEGLLPSGSVDLMNDSILDAQEREASDRMDREEETFAQILARLMQERGMTQVQLAEATNVGQSAVSMLLSRDCRPQRRTVKKIARALGVKPEELWPNFNGGDRDSARSDAPIPPQFTLGHEIGHMDFTIRRAQVVITPAQAVFDPSLARASSLPHDPNDDHPQPVAA